MVYSNFENADLPKVNPHESLETISGNRLRFLFPVEKFEIRTETDRDKGIDFHIELKKELASGDRGYTNYRAVIQLKATNTIEPSADGSFGMQISTSNMMYLLNNAMPAYYVFYHHSTQSFYYENVKNFAAQLQSKKPGWHKQQKHKIYFTRKHIQNHYVASCGGNPHSRPSCSKILLLLSGLRREAAAGC